MAPRGLDPWAQVLGKKGLHIGALPTATLLGGGASVPGQSKPPVQCTPPRHSVLLAWLTAMATQSKPGIQRDRVFLGVGRPCTSPPQCCKGQEAMPQATAGQEGMSGAPQGLSIPAPCDGGAGRTSLGPPSGSGTAPICIPAQAGGGPPAAHRTPPTSLHSTPQGPHGAPAPGKRTPTAHLHHDLQALGGHVSLKEACQ